MNKKLANAKGEAGGRAYVKEHGFQLVQAIQDIA